MFDLFLDSKTSNFEIQTMLNLTLIRLRPDFLSRYILSYLKLSALKNKFPTRPFYSEVSKIFKFLKIFQKAKKIKEL